MLHYYVSLSYLIPNDDGVLIGFTTPSCWDDKRAGLYLRDKLVRQDTEGLELHGCYEGDNGEPIGFYWKQFPLGLDLDNLNLDQDTWDFESFEENTTLTY